MDSAIEKVLSKNDTGETGSHQAGILVPKQSEILSFFPPLGADTKNPRVFLDFMDELGGRWKFAFIYYNNRFYGGTRNEYRLTRMTPYIKAFNLKEGDKITLRRNTKGDYSIVASKAKKLIIKGFLKLSLKWKVVKI